MAQAMFARQVAVSSVNSGSVVTSTLQGGDLVLMGAVMNAAAFYIMTLGIIGVLLMLPMPETNGRALDR